LSTLRDMKTREYLDYLSSLRREIGSLSVVQCRMAHERVLIVPDSMLPVVCRFPEGAYKRIGLCSSETRAQRLGCSHTMARTRLAAAIIELEPADERGGTALSFLRDELHFLDNEIHLIDHRKGDAEKALARILEDSSGDARQVAAREKLRSAEQDIQALERLHSRYVHRIGVLRDKIVTEMDRLIEATIRNHGSKTDVSDDVDGEQPD
jgi:hypothetical protein